MDPIEVLKNEHTAIERMLKVLIVASQKAETDEELDVDLFEKAIDFIRTFADKCHHAKEEGVLFPLIEERGVPKEGGPIGMMLQEHDMGRSYVRGMVESLRKYKFGDKSQANAVSRNAEGYVNLLSQHIQKENDILYPMGEHVISDSDRETLTKKFEDREENEIGKGVHEKYHHLLEELETKMNINHS